MVATVEQLAALVRGRLVGDGSVSIRSARPVAEAGPGDITFIESERYAKLLRGSPASAAIVGPHFNSSRPAINEDLAVIEVDDPISAFVAVRNHLSGEQKPRWTGIHPQASVSVTARIGLNVAVHPFVYVGERAEIGDGTTLFPGVVVGDGAGSGKAAQSIPTQCCIPMSSLLTESRSTPARCSAEMALVIAAWMAGTSRFLIPAGWRSVAMSRSAPICAIDRATFEATRIGEGTKIDNLVMIGHNNQIGRHNLLCGQVGIAGSCTTGDNVVMAGQAGIKDKTQIGDGVIVGAQAGVHRNIPSGQQVLGSPAIPVREQRRIFQMIARLPEMHRQFRELAAQIDVITAALSMQAETDRASARVADPEADREIDPQADPTGF